MTDVWDQLAATTRPEPERDRYGRYVIIMDGKRQSYTRVTTIVATLADKYALNLWSQRMTAIGLVRRQDLYARVATVGEDERDTLNALVEEAKEAAAANAGRNFGTALHAATERSDRGEKVVLPAPWDADLETYRTKLAAAGITIIPGRIEQIVLLPELKVAGTYDRIVDMQGADLPRIFDVKTGGFLPWDEIAIQLALYAHAGYVYDPASKKREPMPPVDQEVAIVAQIRPGEATCRLYAVDIAAGWEAAQTAMWVRKWRNRKNLHAEFAAGDCGLRAEHARTRLTKLVELDAAVVWPLNVPTFRQARETGHTYTPAELEQIEAAIGQAEAQVDAPFGAEIPQADDERIAALRERLVALPADLLAVAEREAKAALVPNLRSGRCSVRDLDRLDDILKPLEQQFYLQDLTGAGSALEEGATA